MIIAIDGTSASGKGTLAKNLQRFFNFAYLDTGALYRSVAKQMMEQNKNVLDQKLAIEIAKSLNPKTILLLQNDSAIRTEDCGQMASKVSAIPEVREALFDFQRNFAFFPVFPDGKSAKGAILDGRDIGTVVCPEADVKIFLSASAENRAKRRQKDLQKKGNCAKYEEVLADIIARDERDSKRATAPLRPADDAFVLDTSPLDSQQVFELVLDFIKTKTKI